MEALVGLVGAAVGIGLFMLGFFVGSKMQRQATPVPDAATEAMKQRRMELQAEQDAFQKLVNYNVDVAYNSRPVKNTDD